MQHAHASVAQEEKVWASMYMYFHHLKKKTGENSAEIESQVPVYQGTALLSGVALVFSEWQPVGMSAPNGFYYNRGEVRRSEQEVVRYKQKFTCLRLY